jgi:hypothetical protein
MVQITNSLLGDRSKVADDTKTTDHTQAQTMDADNEQLVTEEDHRKKITGLSFQQAIGNRQISPNAEESLLIPGGQIDEQA